MNKRLMVLAVAAAVSAPTVAFADDSTVTLYGRANVTFENVKATGCALNAAGTACAAPAVPVTGNVQQRNRVSSNSSNIGFKGVEPLGGGLDAWFQVENSVSFDTGGDTWASRNTGVGLKGAFGSVLLGKWDTPYKASNLGRLDLWGTGIGTYSPVISGVSGSAVGATAAVPARSSFDRRESNTVQYWSPNLAGFSARIGYTANEPKTNSIASPQADPSVWSATVGFDNGPFWGAIAYEKHDEFANVAVSATNTVKTDDKALKVGGGINMGGHLVGVMFERLKYEGAITAAAPAGLFKTVTDTTTLANMLLNPGGFASEVKADSWLLGYQGTFGPHIIRAVASQSKEIKVDGTKQPGTKASFYTVGYAFAASKRTELYALFAKVKNDNNSRSDFGNNSLGTYNGSTGACTGACVGNGADPQGVAVGIKHVF